MSVSLDELARAKDGETDNAACPWRVADHVALGRLLSLTWLRFTHMQIEDITVCVVIGVIEAQCPYRYVYVLHDLGPFRLANAETMRAGACS